MTDPLLTAAEVGELLKISEISVRRSPIRKTYIGRFLRYTNEAVSEYVASCTQPESEAAAQPELRSISGGYFLPDLPEQSQSSQAARPGTAALAGAITGQRTATHTSTTG